MSEQTRTTGTPFKRTLGVASVVIMVVATMSPLAALAGNVPLAIARGNGTAVPATYLLIGALLVLFVVGFSRMSHHVSDGAAGFSAYIRRGLGSRAGGAAGLTGVLGYFALTVAVCGYLGAFLSSALLSDFGLAIPWWICSTAGLLVATAAGVRGIDMSMMLIGVILIAETSLVLAFDVAVLLQHGSAVYDPVALDFAAVFTGATGTALSFVFLSFIGFESAAVYGEESKSGRTIAKSAFWAVGLITVFFAGSTWLAIVAAGKDPVGLAQEKPGGFFAIVMSDALGGWAASTMNWLVVASFLAVIVAGVNVTSRYMFGMGRITMLPAALGVTHPTLRTPVRAIVVVAAAAILVIAIFAVQDKDPLGDLAASFAGVGTVVLVLLQAGCSIALIAYFRRRKDARVWSTAILPGIAAVGLTALGAMVIKDWQSQIGDQDGWLLWLPIVILVTLVAGTIRAGSSAVVQATAELESDVRGDDQAILEPTG